MKKLSIILFILGLSMCAPKKPEGINLAEYLKPRCDTLSYNCIYNSFHASGLYDTVELVYRKVAIEGDTAYYISRTTDTTGLWAQLASFSGSAMIFKNDSVWLASLTENESPNGLTRERFTYILPPGLTISRPIELAKLKWSFVMEVLIKDYLFEDVSVGDTVLKSCLRLNLSVYDRSTEPLASTVWLSKDYGTVKWVRTTGREEVLDLARFRKNCR